MVRPRESAAAEVALEWLRARVLPVVAGQLVGTGEAPLTSLPRARVRFFTWKKIRFLVNFVLRFIFRA